jgi:hypothetical protein
MDFKIQDILKNIIPGVLVLAFLFLNMYLFYPERIRWIEQNSIKNYSEVVFTVFLVAAYVTGYFLDTVSSWFQRLLYLIFKKPSYLLINNRTHRRFKLHKRDDIINNLSQKHGLSINTTNLISQEFSQTLFKLANIDKDYNPQESIYQRVTNFYNSYVFSRNLLATACILILFQLIFFPFNWKILITLLIILITLMIRWMEKSLYYSREVFNSSLF